MAMNSFFLTLFFFDWNNLCSSRNMDNIFIDTILDNTLNQVVESPTCGKNVLDLVFVGDASTVQSVVVEPNFGGSDHRVVCCEIQCPVPKITFAKKKIRLYSKGDYVALNDEVKNFDWNSYLNSKCIETNWSRFKRKYEELLDKYVPFKLVQIGQRHKPPWGNYRSIAKAKVNRRKAKIHAEKTGLVADKILYEEAQDHVNVTITQAKGHYEDKLVEELNTNPKRFWNYTRHFSRSTSTIDFLHDCGERIVDDTKKAELLNDFRISFN